ncbi:thiamine transporter 1 isoform X2 [Eurosta solidaginis]|uniref:thiamine transporter 1 isoform X2 n=1 Tax=Eurosta solidaginis TaxID=178769 RepID=UPI003530F1FB
MGQVFYGTFMASEVAYYTYIYAKVDKERYQIVTGHTRSAILCGRFLAGVLAQIFVSSDTVNYKGLHYFSFGSQIVSLFIAILLPPVHKSLYFYTEDQEQPDLEPNNRETTKVAAVSLDSVQTTDLSQNGCITAAMKTVHSIDSLKKPRFSWRNAYQLILKHIVSAYTNRIVIRWSFWWALATCGQVQIISYVQFLWKEIDANNESFYNGAIEAIVTLLGAGSAMFAGIANTSQHIKWHMWILTMCSLFMGAFIIISALTKTLWTAYIMYILFGICYYFIITTASAIIAENLSDDSFGLIFGINQLVALILQVILTVVVVTDNGYGLKPRQQFLIYGIYFIVLAVMYFVAVFMRILLQKLRCCYNYGSLDIIS